MDINTDFKDEKIKSLRDELCWIHLGGYLQTDDFENYISKEPFLKDLWKKAKDEITNHCNYAFSSIKNTEYYQQAFDLVINTLWFQLSNTPLTPRQDISCSDYYPMFCDILVTTLLNYIRWHKGDPDLTRVWESLEKLGMSHDQIDRLKNAKKEKSQSEFIAKIKGESKGSKVEIDDALCFVMMPFKKSFDPVYRDMIEPVVADLKLKCMRADGICKSTSIIDDICEHIRKARVLIADLTCKKPNVFYALGFAHALNKDVILLAQDRKKDVPFDLQHRRVIAYREDGLEEAKEQLSAFVKEIIGKEKKR